MKSASFIKLTSKKREQESGSVLAELTLIIPMLTFLILAVTDFGMFLQTYFQVCHIGREGLRTAESTPDLSRSGPFYGRYVVTTDNPTVLAFSPAAGLTNEHRFIHERVQMLLKANNGSSLTHSLQLTNNAVEVSTKCMPSGGPAGTDLVEVQLSATYKPITPFNDMLAAVGFSPLTFTFTTKTQGAYLFDSCAA